MSAHFSMKWALFFLRRSKRGERAAFVDHHRLIRESNLHDHGPRREVIVDVEEVDRIDPIGAHQIPGTVEPEIAQLPKEIATKTIRDSEIRAALDEGARGWPNEAILECVARKDLHVRSVP